MLQRRLYWLKWCKIITSYSLLMSKNRVWNWKMYQVQWSQDCPTCKKTTLFFNSIKQESKSSVIYIYCYQTLKTNFVRQYRLYWKVNNSNRSDIWNEECFTILKYIKNDKRIWNWRQMSLLKQTCISSHSSESESHINIILKCGT